MPRTVEFNGQQHEFPDNATDDQVRAALTDHQTGFADRNAQFWKQQGSDAVDLIKGIGAGAIGTVFHGGDLIRRGLGMERVIDRPDVKAAMTAPDSTAGKIGQFAEQAGEFALPMSGVAKLVKGAPLAARLAAEALTAGATSGVQTGGNLPAMAESALTTGALGGLSGLKGAAVPLVKKLVDASPRPLSQGAQSIAQRFGIPLTRGMQGGSRTVQAAEKMLGHTVAPDLYEPVLESAQQGLNTGAKDLSGGFSTDKFSAGDKTIKTMLGEADRHSDIAKAEYSNLAQHEADPANVREIQTGTKPSMVLDAEGKPTTTPVTEDIGLPVDMRPTKEALEPLVDQISRRMTPAQRRADPGLAAIQNIITRPDHLPASVAEADLSYLKEIMRSDASGQAKRLAGKAIDSLDTQVQNAVSQAGPDALDSLKNARSAWKSRSDILDSVKELSGDVSGGTGQVQLANKLLQPSDASFPALQKVLKVAPQAADDLGKAYLAERVFKNVAADGSDFTNPKQAANLWNQIGTRTKAALYSPQQISDIDDFMSLARRVAENPNPSNTGSLNAMLKMGALVVHPVAGAASLVFGRNLAKVLYTPEGAANLRIALMAPGSPTANKAMLVVKSLMNEAEAPAASAGTNVVSDAAPAPQTAPPAPAALPPQVEPPQ